MAFKLRNPFYTTEESFLNGGLYNNICQRLRLFAKNVERILRGGLVREGDFVLTNAEMNSIEDSSQENGKIQQLLNALLVKKNSESKTIKLKEREENIAQEDVMEKINQRKWLERRILNTLTEELKNIKKHFIFQQNGGSYGKRFMRGIIGLAKTRNVKRKAEDCMPIISCQWEYARIPLINQTLLPCAIHATKERNIGVKNGAI